MDVSVQVTPGAPFQNNHYNALLQKKIISHILFLLISFRTLKNGGYMKFFTLLLFTICLLCSGCGEDVEGNEDLGETDINEDFESDREEEREDGDPSVVIDEPGEGETDEEAVAQAEESTGNSCASYTKPCSGGTECSAKYNDCLKPNAGTVTKTTTMVCTKDTTSRTYILNEYSSKGGVNNLLCDLIEEGRILHMFATNDKSACEQRRQVQESAHTAEGYTCQL